MQAIRNKFHGKHKRASVNNNLASAPGPNTVEAFHTESHDKIGNTAVDRYEDGKVDIVASRGPVETITTTTSTVIETVPLANTIPLPPPLPPVMSFKSAPILKRSIPVVVEQPAMVLEQSFSSRSEQMLPTTIIEKPVVVHETIRREEVEEIQPVVHVEREKTEIRQVTQPLFDKEIRPVVISERVLPTEILPVVEREGLPAPISLEASTQVLDATKRQVIEKPAIIQETDKWRVIEEITPIIYRETIVPHVIRVTRPIQEVIVESPIYTEQLLGSRELSLSERQRWGQYFRELPSQALAPPTTMPFYGQRSAVMIPIQSTIPVPPPLPPVHKERRVALPKKKRAVTETTVTTVERPGLMVTNELLYADGANGNNTLLDGANPFNRDYLLADNPITHNEFSRQARDHHGDLKTAGPYLTSEPSLRGSHNDVVTALGKGGAHFVDPKIANRQAATSYEPTRRV